ncbi:Ig-like domain-containing protein [Simiduia curdlanivorans]|uniref:Ig-like domain-containing protein n=1 Tax=Simiduia curdlanivorans TaxID=1492769 RepID=A0ABV8V1B5_9GAMM|nr:Ig-like domain-containing protein [Simiduia curdlanivorans]MDN3637673.1 Ig-like domain-containing protein [Simiduia curdlanivorans]
MQNRFLNTFLLFISILSMTACGGGGGGGSSAPTPQSQTISFTESGTVELFVGDVRTTTASAPSSADIQFSLSEAGIIDIDASGTITALAAGSTTLTLTAPADSSYNAATLSIPFVVSKREQTLSLTNGDSIQAFVDSTLTNPINGAGSGAYSYSSSNPDVASVDDQGAVTLLNAGEASINISRNEDEQYLAASTSYTVQSLLNPQTLSFGQNALQLLVDGSQANPATGAQLPVSYASSDNNIISVDATGQVTAMAAGTATITATAAGNWKYAGASAQYTVTSNRIEQSIAFAQTGPLAKFVDDSVANPASGGAGDGGISYNLSNPDLASIDAEGNVSLNQAGSLVVTATKAQDRKYTSASAQYTVNTSRIEQSIAFAQAGPFERFVDDSVANPASGGAGDGEISYSLSNPDLASIDAEGNISLNQAGSLVVTATKAQDRKYAGASAQYTVHTSLIDQTIAYGLTEPVREITEAVFTKSLTDGPGEGDTSYTSSNEEVASVDAAGQVTILSPGLATITATKAAGRKYNQASDSYDIEAVNRTTSFVAWVGEDGADITFQAGSDNVEFVASQDAVCDFDAANACTQGQHQTISNAEISDTAFTLYNKGFYQFRFGNYYTQLPVNTQRWGALVKHKVVTHEGRLLLVGGSSYYGEPPVDTWSSNDGIDWSLENSGSITSRRYDSGLASFKGKLWFIGGRFNSTYGDIWSSLDGSTWTQDVALAEFGKRKFIHLMVIGAKLYLVGGYNDSFQFTNDVWVTEDGIAWQKIGDFELNSEVTLAVSYSNKLWVFTQRAYNDFRAYSSDDGANWIEQSNSLPFRPSINGSITEFEGRIWVLDDKTATPWSSADGITWRQEAAIPAGLIVNSALAVINDQLLLIAGGNDGSVYRANDEVYRYEEDKWLLISNQSPGNKKPAVLFNYNDKLHLLAQTAGSSWNQMLSSEDGLTWQMENAPEKRSDFILPSPLALNGTLWLIDGRQLYSNRSQYSLDGKSWQKLVQTPPWPNRNSYHQIFKHDDRIWVMGGTSSENSSLRLNDLWSTADGENWQQHTDNELFTRDSKTAFSFQEKLMFFSSYTNSMSKWQTDVWSSIDGETWMKEADTTEFGPRKNVTLFEFQNRLWLIGGYKPATKTWAKDIWSSADGIHWYLEADNLPMGELNQASVTVKNNMIYMNTMGSSQYGIWRSSDGINWQKRYQHQAHFPLNN